MGVGGREGFEGFEVTFHTMNALHLGKLTAREETRTESNCENIKYVMLLDPHK